MSMILGAQLYTLRDYCRDLESFALTLKKVADMGYTTVQVSGSCAYEGDWLQEQLKKNGLRCVITHFSPDRISGEPEKTAQFHDAFECRYIGIGSAPKGLKNDAAYEDFRDTFLPAAQCFKRMGKYLMYHNHYMEFAKDVCGKRYLERMAENFAPDEMGFTLDSYWLQYAGADPAAWIRLLKGRVPCIHLKDMAIVNGEQRMAPVGEGNIHFEAVLLEAEKAGTQHLLIEQDDCYGEDPFDCLKRSYEYLRAQGLR